MNSVINYSRSIGLRVIQLRNLLRFTYYISIVRIKSSSKSSTSEYLSSKVSVFYSTEKRDPDSYSTMNLDLVYKLLTSSPTAVGGIRLGTLSRKQNTHSSDVDIINIV